VRIIVPARNGSKGFPNKNLILFDYLLEGIPKPLWSRMLVVTDNTFLQDICSASAIEWIDRPEQVSNDEASTKSVMEYAIEEMGIEDHETIIMLYTTYPERTYRDIVNAISFLVEHKADSLLCAKEPKTHPYLCLKANGNKGIQLEKHDLYRRQDYPKCFEISHYISIFKAGELKNLNNNLYNKNTIFFPIEDKIDIDTEADFEKFKNTRNEF